MQLKPANYLFSFGYADKERKNKKISHEPQFSGSHEALGRKQLFLSH